MIIQAIPYGTKKEEPFAFTYSGDFTDSRVDGIGDVTLNTSGTLVTTGQTVKVRVYILAGGGGAVRVVSDKAGSGGGGGNQTVEVDLAPGTYEIVIGTGGASGHSPNGYAAYAGNGGNTSAFGYTSTGGGRAYCPGNAEVRGGVAGSPNGKAGSTITGYSNTVYGASPNGGAARCGYYANPGGNGLVRITFSQEVTT